MTIPNTYCEGCRHWPSDDLEIEYHGCQAFPKGIPRDIYTRRVKHDKPLPEQDNDLVYVYESTGKDIPGRIYEGYCESCQHYDVWLYDGRGGCEAFPDGMPKDIYYGRAKHDKPLPGQNNDLVYESTGKDFFDFSLCKGCLHWPKNGVEVLFANGCRAFPKGIPRDIFYRAVKHDRPIPGQENNLVYESMGIASCDEAFEGAGAPGMGIGVFDTGMVILDVE